jgi:hypothetical protein
MILVAGDLAWFAPVVPWLCSLGYIPHKVGGPEKV